MIRHDTAALEKKGQTPGGYVPRAPHPILDKPPANESSKTEEENSKHNQNVIKATESGDGVLE